MNITSMSLFYSSFTFYCSSSYAVAGLLLLFLLSIICLKLHVEAESSRVELNRIYKHGNGTTEDGDYSMVPVFILSEYVGTTAVTVQK